MKLIGIILHLYRLNFLSSYEYKLSFWIQVGGMIVNNTLFFSVWVMFFLKFKTIGGVDLGTFALLSAIMLFVFSFMHTLLGGHTKISSLIENGGLDSQLLLPHNLLVRLVVNGLMTSAIGDGIYGCMMLFLVPKISLVIVIEVLILGLVGAFTFVGFLLVFHSLAFSSGRSGNLLKGVFESVLGPAQYPPGIFEGTWLKYLFLSVMPVYYIIHGPFLLIRTFSWSDLILILAGCVFFTSLGIWCFYRGLKRYESGNLVTTNV